MRVSMIAALLVRSAAAPLRLGLRENGAAPSGHAPGGNAQDGARCDSTPWEHGAARLGLGSAAGGYATGFLRGLPRRRTSGAQK